MPAWRFAIISDVHIYSSGRVPPDFARLVQELRGLDLRFVVTSGDATVGNPYDGVATSRVRSWWEIYRGVLKPLVDDGVPHLAIAGNHDFYTDVHRIEYATAWSDLAQNFSAIAPLRGPLPHSYSFDLDGVHFTFAHAVEQCLDPEVEAWLREDLASAEARSAALRLVIGHVPLVSMMGKTSDSYCVQLGSLLAEHGVAAYFSGHEHLVWDQALAFGDRVLRQVHVGTSSGTYHFPLSESVLKQHCEGKHGTLPYSGRRFELVRNRQGKLQQADKVCCCVVEIDDTTYDVRHLTLRDGKLVPFGLDP